MFGKRNTPIGTPSDKPSPRSDAAEKPAHLPVATAPATAGAVNVAPNIRSAEMDHRLSEVKISVFNDLMATVDLGEFAKLDHKAVREAISEIVGEIINMRNLMLSAAEQQTLITDICNDILGLGPLEPLLARDDIADIMVNGFDKVYIETNGIIQLTDVKFRDNQQLMNI